MASQTKIIQHLAKVETATKAELYQNSSYSYYHNWQKHFGDVLSRMVKNGSIERVKNGVYKLKSSGLKNIEKDPNQLEIF